MPKGKYPHKTTPLSVRFHSKYEANENGCWIWTATMAGSGYGTIGLGARVLGKEFAHRVSWMLHYGDIPEGMIVCHRCDVKLCVNPEHLFLGTHKDNSDDMYQKGRGNRGRKRPEAHCVRGSRHGGAKLTEAQVREIRVRWANRETQKVIASSYGISRGMVGLIVSGKNWSHV